MRSIGIDFGSKRVGIAISDERGEFAMPHAVLPNGPDLVATIAALCVSRKVNQIIIGESRNFKQELNPIMKKASVFAREIGMKTNLPVHMEPEFFTSAEAERIQGKNDMLDASAAALILKSYLDKKNNHGK